MVKTRKPRKDPAAVHLGRKGGRAKVAKGFSMLTPEERKENARKAAAARWAKKAVLVAVLLLLTAGRGWGRDALTGENWLKWNEAGRLLYVTGVLEVSDVLTKLAAMQQKGLTAEQVANVPNPYIPAAGTVGSLEEAIDRFYSEPANRSITILGAMMIVTAKFNGATEECVTAKVISARLSAAHDYEKGAAAWTREKQACGE